MSPACLRRGWQAARCPSRQVRAPSIRSVRTSRGAKHTSIAERELGFVAAGHFGDCNIGASPVIDVRQQDTPRVLGLCASQQSPHGRLAEIGDVFGRVDRDRPVREHRQARRRRENRSTANSVPRSSTCASVRRVASGIATLSAIVVGQRNTVTSSVATSPAPPLDGGRVTQSSPYTASSAMPLINNRLGGIPSRASESIRPTNAP